MKKKINDLANNGCFIENLVWIDVMIESDALEEILYNMRSNNYLSIINQSITDKIIEDEFDGKIVDLVLDWEIRGFIAECRHMIRKDIKFDEKGNFRSAMISAAYCQVFYVYAKTLEELIDLITVKNNEIDCEEVEQAKIAWQLKK